MYSTSLPSIIVALMVVAAPLCAGEVQSACCVGSGCLITTESDCNAQDGHFLPGTVFCGPSVCAIGVCCTFGPTCAAEDDFGQPMTAEMCNGTYEGGAECDDPGACNLWPGPPAGYEIVELPVNGQFILSPPDLNNCGEIVVSNRLGDSWADSEIFLYDNGALQQLTTNDDRDVIPRINDRGTVMWSFGEGENGANSIVQHRDGQTSFFNVGGRLAVPNNLNQVVFNQWFTGCPSTSDIRIFDGESFNTVFSNGNINQWHRLNDHGELVWVNEEHPCPSSINWTGVVSLLTGGSLSQLTDPDPQVQQPWINNLGTIVWTNLYNVVLWENGTRTDLAYGDLPTLNDRGDIAFPNASAETLAWYVLAYYKKTGQFHQISSESDKLNGITNSRPKINNQGEIVWWWRQSAADLVPSGIRYMRRIRTGDIDIDDDVDLDDFARFPDCYTGPIETDRLCECRFLDIDHDRDVDWDDFSLFLSNYTGPPTDCNGRIIQDIAERFVDGSLLDCNLNGVPDDCDLSQSTSADLNGNGVPDECDCPAFAPIRFTTLPPRKNRYLSFIPEVAYWTPLTAFLDPALKDKPAAIRVKLVDSTVAPQSIGEIRWVGPPVVYPDTTTPLGTYIAAELQCAPHYRDWDEVAYMHAFGDIVVPNSTYELQIIAESCTGVLLDESNYSAPTSITTVAWGDCCGIGNSPPDGDPSFIDISATVLGFQGDAAAPFLPRIDLRGPASPPQSNHPDNVVDFLDIGAAVDAFQGHPYPFELSSCP